MKDAPLAGIERDRDLLVAILRDFVRCRSPNPPGDTLAARHGQCAARRLVCDARLARDVG